jgi:hypothetical protein
VKSEAQSTVPSISPEVSENVPPPPTFSVNLETFKVLPCIKGRGSAHNRKLCPYYHNLKDRRRKPGSYEPEPCPECFDSTDLGDIGSRVGGNSTASTCPRGDDCSKCHNRLELLYHDRVFKKRFCATFLEADCQRGDLCAFAHSNNEIRVDLLTPEEEQLVNDFTFSREATDPGQGMECTPAVAAFFTHRFKTLWCPHGIQHDWHRCLYAHTYQDWRRNPEIGYSSEPCSEWCEAPATNGLNGGSGGNERTYEQRCSKGFNCKFAHGSKEQLYHPQYYKTMPCTNFPQREGCPRGAQCAFFHSSSEKRMPVPGSTSPSVVYVEKQVVEELPPIQHCLLPGNAAKGPSPQRKPKAKERGYEFKGPRSELKLASSLMPTVQQSGSLGQALQGFGTQPHHDVFLSLLPEDFQASCTSFGLYSQARLTSLEQKSMWPWESVGSFESLVSAHSRDSEPAYVRLIPRMSYENMGVKTEFL